MTIRRHRRRRSEDRTEPTGTPPTYITHLDDLIDAGDVAAIILYGRVSGQAQRAQLEDQTTGLRHRVGIPVVEVFAEVAPGWNLQDRPGLDAAILAAKAYGPGAIILAESTDRYLRHPEYNADKKSQPTASAFEDLSNRAQGVPLATVLHPDAPFEEVRYFQQNRGQVAKGNSGGRPPKPASRPPKPASTPKGEPGYKKRQKKVMLSKVFWFTFVAGLSVEKTALILKEHPNQIQRWRNKLRGR